MVTYDAKVIQKFADIMYARARSLIAISIVFGVVFGAAVGFIAGAWVTTTTPNFNEGVRALFAPGLLIGAVAGAVLFGLLFFASGRAGAERLRLQAQVALCQMQIEQNTRTIPPAPIM